MNWAVATTLPNKELRGQAELEKRDFSCYLPVRLQQIQHAKFKRALFPGYLFFRIDSAWQRIFDDSILNVQGVLMFGGELSHIPQTVIDELKSREDKDGYIKIPVPQRFRHGQLVRTQNGAFCNIDGIFDRQCVDSERARVLYEILGRPTFVELNEKDLYAVNYGRMSRAKRKRLRSKTRRAFHLATLNA